jgi:hypothetical protein
MHAKRARIFASHAHFYQTTPIPGDLEDENGKF